MLISLLTTLSRASLNLSQPLGVPLHLASDQVVAPRKEQVKARDKARSKQRRRAARDRDAKEASVKQSAGRHIKLVSLKRCQQARVVHINIDIQSTCTEVELQLFRFADIQSIHRADAGAIPNGASRPSEPLTGVVARTGFVGRRLRPQVDDHRPLTKADALKLELQYVEWDGRYVSSDEFQACCSCSYVSVSREARPLLDKASRVFAVLVGSPRDAEGWAQVNADAQQALDAARSAYKLDPKQVSHRRGSFPAIAAGISYGGGQKVTLFLPDSHIASHSVWATL